jgi:hypothetical protein
VETVVLVVVGVTLTEVEQAMLMAVLHTDTMVVGQTTMLVAAEVEQMRPLIVETLVGRVVVMV